MMICCSFSKQAGSFGMIIHNRAAKHYDLDFLYKSFSVDDIGEAIKAMRLLKFRGAGISMPYKIEVIRYLDQITNTAHFIGAVNTVINDNGILIGHNTDWEAALLMIKKKIGTHKRIVILGNGGFAKAVKYATEQLQYESCVVDRKHWHLIPMFRDQLIFNCTPVKDIPIHFTNTLIDSAVNTETGKEMALQQATRQFQLYTNKIFPNEIIEEIMA